MAGASPLDLSFYYSAYGAHIGVVTAYIVDASTGVIQGNAIWSHTGDLGTPNWFLAQPTGLVMPTSPFRIAWSHDKQGFSSGWRADFALDTITIDGSLYDFDSSNDNFLTTENLSTSSSSTALSNAVPVPTTTGASRGRWNRGSGSTGSGNTGPNGAQSGSSYVYTEASSPNHTSATYFWLFSPVITP
jgi:hypothetical protein